MTGSMSDAAGLTLEPTARRPVRLDLGSGPTPRAGFVGIDIRGGRQVIKSDVRSALEVLPSESVDEIYSRHFLEHSSDVALLMSEISRVLRFGAFATVIVPHFSSPYYYSDYSHVSRFGLYSMSYFVKDEFLRRRVPHYHPVLPLTLTRARLRSRSPSEFRRRNLLKQLIWNPLFRSRAFTEFYEENLVWIAPCYEIEFTLQKT